MPHLSLQYHLLYDDTLPGKGAELVQWSIVLYGMKISKKKWKFNLESSRIHVVSCIVNTLTFFVSLFLSLIICMDLIAIKLNYLLLMVMFCARCKCATFDLYF